MSYEAKSDQVLAVQLKVQEVCLTLADTGVLSANVAVNTIKLGEPVQAVVACIHVDDSAADCLAVAKANIVIDGDTVTVTTAAALQATDALILKYIVKE